MDLHAPLHPAAATGTGSAFAELGRYVQGDTARASDRSSARYGRMYDRALRYVDEQVGHLI